MIVNDMNNVLFSLKCENLFKPEWKKQFLSFIHLNNTQNHWLIFTPHKTTIKDLDDIILTTASPYSLYKFRWIINRTVMQEFKFTLKKK